MQQKITPINENGSRINLKRGDIVSTKWDENGRLILTLTNQDKTPILLKISTRVGTIIQKELLFSSTDKTSELHIAQIIAFITGFDIQKEGFLESGPYYKLTNQLTNWLELP